MTTEPDEILAARPIRSAPREALPGIQPTLFRELDHRIAQTRLEHEPLSDAFLKKGMIVYTEGRIADSRLRFNATPDDVIDGAPLVVLVTR